MLTTPRGPPVLGRRRFGAHFALAPPHFLLKLGRKIAAPANSKSREKFYGGEECAENAVIDSVCSALSIGEVSATNSS